MTETEKRRGRGRPPGQSIAGKNRYVLASSLRAAGMTWQAIGDKLGITRQGASQLVKRNAK